MRLTFRKVLVGSFLLGLCVVATCSAKPPMPVVSPDVNIIQNPGFEQIEKNMPAGWTFEKRVADKGSVSLGDIPVHAGKKHVRLTPNNKNEDRVHPLAIGQGFPIDPFRGKKVQLSGWLAAEGPAIATLGLFTIRKDGTIAEGLRLSQTSRQQELTYHNGVLAVPADDDSLFIVLSCSVDGTKGSGIFDDITVREYRPTASAPAVVEMSAEIQVDADRDIREIPATIYGTNIEWIFDGYGLWDSRKGALNNDIVNLTRELHPSLLRFPGGVFSDFYHWKEGVGPQSARGEAPHVPNAAKSRHSFGTDEALQFARETKSQLLITANAGTGTPQEAAAWVSYVNKKGDSPNVLYWEVGNELYGLDEANKTVTMPPKRYAEKYLQFAKAMRAADPHIKLGAIGGENFGSYKMNGYPNWNRELLTRAGDQIDFLAVHNAYAPLLFMDRGEDVRTTYAAMLAAPLLIRDNFRTLSDQIEKLAPAQSQTMKIAITEWGPWFHAVPENRFVDHVKTLGSALYVASMLKVFIESPRVEIANAFKLVDNAFMGWIGLRGGAYIPKVPYYAMQMYTQHFGHVLVDSSVKSDTYDSVPAGLVDRVNSVPYLDLIVSRSSDRKKLYVLVINKHFENAIATKIKINAFTPATEGIAWTLNGPSIDAHTGTQLPKIPGLNWAHQTGAEPDSHINGDRADEVKLASSPVHQIGPEFTYTFPAHSITSLELSEAK